MTGDHHCPFLNRSDVRCSAHFRLDRLDSAFGDCFDQYRSCAVYRELLVERRVRRAAAGVLRQRGPAHASAHAGPERRATVELTVHGRNCGPAAATLAGASRHADAQYSSAA